MFGFSIIVSLLILNFHFLVFTDSFYGGFVTKNILCEKLPSFPVSKFRKANSRIATLKTIYQWKSPSPNLLAFSHYRFSIFNQLFAKPSNREDDLSSDIDDSQNLSLEKNPHPFETENSEEVFPSSAPETSSNLQRQLAELQATRDFEALQRFNETEKEILDQIQYLETLTPVTPKDFLNPMKWFPNHITRALALQYPPISQKEEEAQNLYETRDDEIQRLNFELDNLRREKELILERIQKAARVLEQKEEEGMHENIEELLGLNYESKDRHLLSGKERSRSGFQDELNHYRMLGRNLALGNTTFAGYEADQFDNDDALESSQNDSNEEIEEGKEEEPVTKMAFEEPLIDDDEEEEILNEQLKDIISELNHTDPKSENDETREDSFWDQFFQPEEKRAEVSNARSRIGQEIHTADDLLKYSEFWRRNGSEVPVKTQTLTAEEAELDAKYKIERLQLDKKRRGRKKRARYRFLAGRNLTVDSNILLFPFNYTKFDSAIEKLDKKLARFLRNTPERGLARYKTVQDAVANESLVLVQWDDWMTNERVVSKSVREKEEELINQMLEPKITPERIRSERENYLRKISAQLDTYEENRLNYSLSPLSSNRAEEKRSGNRSSDYQIDYLRRFTLLKREIAKNESIRSEIQPTIPFWDLESEDYIQLRNITELMEKGPDWSLLPKDDDDALINYATQIYERLEVETRTYEENSYVNLPPSLYLLRMNKSISESMLSADSRTYHIPNALGSDIGLQLELDDFDEGHTKMTVNAFLTQKCDDFMGALALVKRLFKEFQEFLNYDERVEFHIAICAEDHVRSMHIIPEQIYRKYDYNLTKYFHSDLDPYEFLYLSWRRNLNNTNWKLARASLEERVKEVRKQLKTASSTREKRYLRQYGVDMDIPSHWYVWEPIEVQDKIKRETLKRQRFQMSDEEWDVISSNVLTIWCEGPRNPYLLCNGKLMRKFWGGINPDVLLSGKNRMNMKKRIRYALEEGEDEGAHGLSFREHYMRPKHRAQEIISNDYSEVDYFSVDPREPSAEEWAKEYSLEWDPIEDKWDKGVGDNPDEDLSPNLEEFEDYLEEKETFKDDVAEYEEGDEDVMSGDMIWNK